MRKRAKIVLWIVIAIIVVGAFAATAIRRLHKEEVRSIESVQLAEGVPVDYFESRVVPIQDWRRFVGVAEGFGQVDLTSDFRTRVNAVHARVGDEVRKGKVIVSLDRYDPARIAVNLETAGTRYETARRDSIRMEALFNSGAISQQQLDHVRAEAEGAHAAYQTARRAVELDTPISGILTALYVRGGDYADAGQVVATVASYDEIRIPLEVSDSERSLIGLGQPVRLRLDGRDPAGGVHALQGQVVKAALSADSESRLFQVEVAVRNPEHTLKPGSLVTPEILVATSSDKPVVPRAAVFEQEGRSRVYVILRSSDTQRAELRDVTVGLGDGSLVAINEGLSPGEWVVTSSHTKLQDGIKVKVHSDVTSEYFRAPEESGPGSSDQGGVAE